MSIQNVSRRGLGFQVLALSSLVLGPPFSHAASADVPAVDRGALRVARPTRCVLFAVARAGQRVVIAGERGLILISDDSCRSWTQSAVPVSVSLTALAFANERDGWAVGNLGVVLRTRDGGSSWTRVLDGRTAATIALKAAREARAPASAQGSQSPIEEAQRLVDEGADKPFLNLALQADGSVVVIGAYGLAFSTSNGGKTWNSLMPHLPNPDGFSYYGMVNRGQERFIYGEQGILLRSEQLSEAFVAQQSPSMGSLFAALSLREGPLLLMGLRGKVYRQAGEGAYWETVQAPIDASLFAGLQLADGTALLVGAAGQVLASHDGGRSFASLPVRDRFPFSGAATAPDGSLVLVGQRGLMLVPANELKAALSAHANAGASRRA